MSWPQVALVAINAVQVIALAWIAAWQQRAAQLAREVRSELEALNGDGSRPQEGLSGPPTPGGDLDHGGDAAAS